MAKSMNNKTVIKWLEEQSWYELMTSQPIIDMYVGQILEEPLYYDCEDEKKEKERMIEDLHKITTGHGKYILKELFSDIHINDSLGDRIPEFARRFAQTKDPMVFFYWLQVLVSYTTDLLLRYTFIKNKIDITGDKGETKEEKNVLPSGMMSLSAALKILKSEKYWTPSVAKAFADVGIMSPKELTPARFVALMTKNSIIDKNTGKKVVGIWGERYIKDYDGFKKLYSDGTFKKEKVLRRANVWTMKKLLQALAYNGIVLDLEV